MSERPTAPIPGATIPGAAERAPRTPGRPGKEGAYERRRKALRLPTVQAPVVGRSLLHPASGSVEAAVDTAVGLL